MSPGTATVGCECTLGTPRPPLLGPHLYAATQTCFAHTSHLNAPMPTVVCPPPLPAPCSQGLLLCRSVCTRAAVLPQHSWPLQGRRRLVCHGSWCPKCHPVTRMTQGRGSWCFLCIFLLELVEVHWLPVQGACVWAVGPPRFPCKTLSLICGDGRSRMQRSQRLGARGDP